MSSIYVPDRWHDCGDYGCEEKKKCVGCGDYYDGEERYCYYCQKQRLNDYHYLNFYANEIEADGKYDLKTIRKWAEEDIGEFLDCCEKYDKLMEI